MIYKIVFNKEIHVCDMKDSNSIELLREKIALIFKKLPANYSLFYKDSQGDEIILKNNSDIEALMDGVQKSVKVTKLFIKEQNVQEIEAPLVGQLSNQKPETEAQPKQKSQRKDSYEKLQTSKLSEPEQISTENIEKDNASENVQINLKQTQSNELLRTEIDESKQQVEAKQQENVSKAEKEASRLENERIWELCEKNEKNRDVKLQPVVNVLQQHNRKLPAAKQEQKCPQKEIEIKPSTHEIRCDLCNKFPMVGNRFKCVLCQDYDLCQNCEEKYSHEHPLLKIKYAFQAPLDIKVVMAKVLPESTEKKEMQKSINRFDLSTLNKVQRNDRIFLIASQVSELLQMEFEECKNFIQSHENFSKEHMIEILTQRRYNENQEVKVKRENNPGLKTKIVNWFGYEK